MSGEKQKLPAFFLFACMELKNPVNPYGRGMFEKQGGKTDA